MPGVWFRNKFSEAYCMVDNHDDCNFINCLYKILGVFFKRLNVCVENKSYYLRDYHNLDLKTNVFSEKTAV